MRASLWSIVALIAIFATACSGGSPPSGSTSKAAGGTGNPPGPGPGPGPGPTLRAVGFDAARILPVFVTGTADQIWVFVSGPAALAAPSATVNGGAAAGPVFTAMNQGNTAFWVDLSADPAAAQNNAQIQISANAGADTSNVVIVSTGAFPPNAVPNNTFRMTSPQPFGSLQPQAVPFNFTAASNAVTYFLGVFFIDTAASTAGFPIAVELAAPGLFTAGSGVPATSFANFLIPPLTSTTTQEYGPFVVSLDSNGWGVGGTPDLVGFQQGNPPQAVLDTYPIFNTQ